IVTYIVTPSANGCSGNTFSVVITVNPIATINAMTALACGGVQFTVNPTNSTNGTVPAGTTYTWEMPTYGASVTGGDSRTTPSGFIFGTLNVQGTVAQTAVYIVTPSTSQCGQGSPFTLTVTVNPTVIIRSISRTICSGASFSITPSDEPGNTITGDVTYTWAAPTGSGFSGGEAESISRTYIYGTLNATSNFVASATYVVSPSITSCSAGGTFTVQINVTPPPNVNAISETTCGGVSFTVAPQNGLDGIAPTGTLYTWNAPTVTSPSLTGGNTQSTRVSNIGGTLTNSTNTPQTAVYQVATTLNNCVGNVFTLTISVNPRPALQNVITSTCTDAPFTVSPTTTGVNNFAPIGTTYSWNPPTLSVSLTGGESASGQSFISGTLTNPTNRVLTAAYMVTPTGPSQFGSCVGNPFTITVNVDPKPVIAGILDVFCSGVTFVVSPTNGGSNIVPTNTVYSWSSAPIVSSPSLTGGGVGTNVSFVTGTLFNNTATAQTATYLVTPRFGTCAGAQFAVTITVNPAATIATMSTTVCTGLQFMVTPSASLAGNFIPASTTYTWSNPPTYSNPALSGGESQTSPQTNIFGTILNTSNVTYSATYTVRPTTGICLGNTFQVQAFINPNPQINEMSITGCNGNITATPLNGTNGLVIPANTFYTWGNPTYSSASLTGGASGSQTG
ncbi:MAG: PKD-like domain-containing protein, partial [Pseudomonadota bacterium]